MVYTPSWVDPWQNLAQLVWPAVAVGYRYSAVATRMTRSAMLEVLREDYIRTARAKGLWTKLILTRHALKNAMLPVLTVIALEFAFLLGGLVVTEQVFNLNGLGLLFVQAIAHRDYTLTQALVLLVARRSSSSTSWSTLRSPGSTRASATAEGTMAINPAHRGPRRRRGRRAFDRRRDGVGQFVRRAPARRDRGRSSSLLMAAVAVLAPFLVTHNPLANDYGAMLSPPSAQHWLGTDAHGRDVYSRLIYGSRTALLVGFGASVIGATLGAVLGVAQRLLRRVAGPRAPARSWTCSCRCP